MRDPNVETLLGGLCFGEGPRWRSGRLWFSDMYDYQIKAVDLTGQSTMIIDVPQQPSGLGWLPNGDLLFVSMLDRQVMCLAKARTTVHVDLSTYTEFPLNDLIVGPTGNAYVGNYGFDLTAFMKGESKPKPTRLIHLTACGVAKEVGEPLLFPNGMVITPDGKTLVVAETFASRLTAFDILENGELSNRRSWADLPDVYPDGISLDATGAIWVATARGKRIIRVAQGGKVLDSVTLQNDSFACALGGEDGRTLFIMTSPTESKAESQSMRQAQVQFIRVETPSA